MGNRDPLPFRLRDKRWRPIMTLRLRVLLQHTAIVIAAPNMRGYTLLQQAVINGQCRMVHVLLAHPRMPVAQRDAAAFGGNAWPCRDHQDTADAHLAG